MRSLSLMEAHTLSVEMELASIDAETFRSWYDLKGLLPAILTFPCAVLMATESNPLICGFVRSWKQQKAFQFTSNSFVSVQTKLSIALMCWRGIAGAIIKTDPAVFGDFQT